MFEEEQPTNADRAHAVKTALSEGNALPYRSKTSSCFELAQRIIAHGPRSPIHPNAYAFARQFESFFLKDRK